MNENGSPEPRFETDENRIYFLVTIYVREDANRAEAERDNEKAAYGSRSSMIEARKAAILSFVAAHPSASIEAICEEFGLNQSTVDRDIRSLKDEGLLERVGAPPHGTMAHD